MRIDLHTHSRVSDGTQTPTELVAAAVEAGLDVLAITDHDTAASWPEAERAAARAGLTLVRGMEISTLHQGYGVHLLAYLPDPTYPPLLELLDRILDGRSSRVPAMLHKLRDLGIGIDLDDVRRVSPATTATGRPHVADALVDLGAVGDRTEAFRRYLNAGRPAYVERYAAPLVETLRIVGEAGGVPVIAHPWGRHGHDRPDETSIAELVGLGLAGIEVDHQDHDASARARLREIGTSLGLVVTGSSDYHGSGKIDHELGCNTTEPEQLDRLVALAGAAALRSGRSAPEVLTA
ncbi:MAG: PHP domain-containing protein [Nocardioides sp.]|nr:PHP domain-containing protein [Nocardioides sp.]